MTQADVQRAAERYIQPDKFAVVVVGDLKTIEPGISALNLGPISTVYRRRDHEVGHDMALALTIDELVRYTNCRAGEMARMAASASGRHGPARCSPGGRHETVGKLIDHIFLVERRHLQRLMDVPVAPRTGLTGNNAPPLFDYGASVRRELEQYVADLDDEAADQVRSFAIREEQWQMSPRKLLFHILLHEIRHWAQIALAIRLNGLEPPGEHDLAYSKALR